MTKEDIIKLAREADLQAEYDDYVLERLERFAALVAAASASVEREACAKVCEQQEREYWGSPEEQEWTPIDCAAAIRARGKA